ncbi:hypothetical protein ACFFRR_006123 [Megaselia abdita]
MALLWILLNIIIGIGSIIFFTQHRRLNYWKYRGLIFDEPLLFHGSFGGCSPTETLRNVYTKFKLKSDMVGFFVYLRPAILILNLGLMRTILSDAVDKFSEMNILFDYEFSANTKNVRYKLAPNFNSTRMRQLFHLAARGYCEMFNDSIAIDTPAFHIDITKVIEEHTANVIGSTVFGEYNFPPRLFKPSFENLFGKIKRLLKCRHRTFDEEEFSEALKKCVRNKDSKTDFMNSVLNLHFKNNLDISEIAKQAYEFCFTGYQTSSSTISCCIYELAKNRVLQNTLRNEILLALEDNDWLFSYESLSKMRILNKVLNETLRKHTVVPCLVRKANTNFLVEKSNFVIEKGTILMIPVESIHNDPEIFPQPNDFEPERFSSEEIQRLDPCAFLPFGDGSRVCIGVKFAKLICKVALVMLLGRFDFSLTEETKLIKRKKSFLNSVESKLVLSVQRL